MPKAPTQTQREKLLAYMARHPLARPRDLRKVGVTGTVIKRVMDDGDIIRIGRGLYQLSETDIEFNASLAEVSKQAPKAIICLMSALAFHGLTDQLPRKVWIAIGAKDWEPKISYPRTRTVRFREPYFSKGVERFEIGNVDVKIYSVAKSIADAFRNPKLVDRSVAIECLKTALETRKASPASLANAAENYGTGKLMRPYLEALTSNG